MKEKNKKILDIDYDTPEERKQAEKEAKFFKYISILTASFIAILGLTLFLVFLYLYIF